MQLRVLPCEGLQEGQQARLLAGRPRCKWLLACLLGCMLVALHAAAHVLLHTPGFFSFIVAEFAVEVW